MPDDDTALWSEFLDEEEYASLLDLSDGGEGGGRPPGNFLIDLFPTAVQSLRMAFGADPAGNPELWNWTDVTKYVLWESGANTRIGGANEQIGRPTSAEFNCTLRNDQPNGGDFTIGNPLGRNWPNVRENVPTEALLDLGSGESVCLSGFATAWTPAVSADWAYSVVKFVANGCIRRLEQGGAAARSPMWRFHMLADQYPTSTNGGGDFGIGAAEYESSGQGYHALPVHYWSLEEESGALRAANVINSNYPLTSTSVDALPSFGGGTIGSGSKATATFAVGDRMTVIFPPVAPGADTTGFFPGSTTIVIPFLFRLPALPTGVVELMRFITSGSAGIFKVLMTPVGGTTLSLSVNVYDAFSVLLGTMSLVNDTVALNSDVYITLRLDQQPAGIYVDLEYSVHSSTLLSGDSVNSGSSNALSVAAATLGSLLSLSIGPNSDLPNVGLGHLAIYNSGLGTFPSTAPRAVLGRRGDTPTIRLKRTCLEEGVPLELVGASDILMGPQAIGPLLTIADECQAVDGGFLLDGLHPGLTYITRTQAYSSSAALALTANMIEDFDPTADDQGRINSFTASNPAGGESTFTRVTGDLGTADIGMYASSQPPIPVSSDAVLYDQAAWRVYQSTATGRRLRYPSLTVHFDKPVAAPFAQRWLEAVPSARIDVTGIEQGVRPDRMLLLVGWTQEWNSKVFKATMVLQDYRAWAVGTIAADLGDTGEFLLRPDTDGSTLTVGANPGDTSLTVTTPSGLWVHSAVATYADDIVGLIIDVDGLPIHVTAIVGASSPQTFTVTAADIRRPIPAGATVELWDQTVPGL